MVDEEEDFGGAAPPPGSESDNESESDDSVQEISRPISPRARPEVPPVAGTGEAPRRLYAPGMGELPPEFFETAIEDPENVFWSPIYPFPILALDME